MKGEPEITIRRLTPELLGDYLAFFDGPAFADNPDWADCYCFFPYADGDAALRDAAGRGQSGGRGEAITAGRAEGYLAYAGGPRGGLAQRWSARDRYPQLARLPGDSARTGATPCFTVDPAWRRRGLARRLLAGGHRGLPRGRHRRACRPVRRRRPANDAHRYRGTIELLRVSRLRAGRPELPGGRTLMEKEL